MTFEPEFKKALQLLPEKEKDKLILRLLKHDPLLADRLYFELVDTDSVTEKRELLRKLIIERIDQASEYYYTPGYLLMDLREASGRINDHVTITKDKVGEVFLQCFLLRYALELNNKRIAAENRNKAYTLLVYIIARVFKILLLMQKQHEDLHMEFKDDITAIGELIGQNPNLMHTAIQHGLDVNWLVLFDIPENIDEIYKELRRNGFLK